MESHRNWIQFASAAKNVAVPRRGKCPLIDIQQGRITSKDRFKGQNVADFFHARLNFPSYSAKWSPYFSRYEHNYSSLSSGDCISNDKNNSDFR
jgi:hypothetical protein